jgi:hypothetical protein
MPTPSFEIFSGSLDQNAMWLASVEGLNNACQRMRTCAAAEPGAYFVFDILNRRILAPIDTSLSSEVPKPKPPIRLRQMKFKVGNVA